MVFMDLNGKKITIILTGGIACYKVLDLIRTFKKQSAEIVPIMTQGAKEFITPMSVATLAQAQVHDTLWSLKDEVDIGHIHLARETDLVIVAPASANFMAKIAHGLADDLASTVMLATDKPILFVPAMNPYMYANQATQHNVTLLKERGAIFVEPDSGLMACMEEGLGRFPRQSKILNEITAIFNGGGVMGLTDIKILITLGATQEAIDPVRFISNHSSGKQGIELAKEFQAKGAHVVLVKGTTSIRVPDGFEVHETVSAEEMYQKTDELLKAEHFDAAVCTAAVCDWRAESANSNKIKKDQGDLTDINWVENTDILKEVSEHDNRPDLVIGFAAETDHICEHGKEKLARKGCDMIVYNQVGQKEFGFGSEMSKAGICTHEGNEHWGSLSKTEVAQRIAKKMITFFEDKGKEVNEKIAN